MATALCILSLALMVVLPVYLIFVKRWFWWAFAAAWFCIFAANTFDVIRRLEHFTHTRPVPDYHPNTTQIGMVCGAGWLLALPYCLLIKFTRDVWHYFKRRRSPGASNTANL